MAAAVKARAGSSTGLQLCLRPALQPTRLLPPAGAVAAASWQYCRHQQGFATVAAAGDVAVAVPRCWERWASQHRCAPAHKAARVQTPTVLPLLEQHSSPPAPVLAERHHGGRRSRAEPRLNGQHSGKPLLRQPAQALLRPATSSRYGALLERKSRPYAANQAAPTSDTSSLQRNQQTASALDRTALLMLSIPPDTCWPAVRRPPFYGPLLQQPPTPPCRTTTGGLPSTSSSWLLWQLQAACFSVSLP